MKIFFLLCFLLLIPFYAFSDCSFYPENSDFQGVKVDAGFSDSTDASLITLIDLQRDPNLKKMPVLIQGYLGEKHKTSLCETLNTLGFQRVFFGNSFLGKKYLKPYEALRFIKQDVIRTVFMLEREMDFFGSIHVKKNKNTGMMPDKGNCEVLTLSNAYYRQNVTRFPEPDKAKQCRTIIVLPSINAIQDEMAFQAQANLKRITPMDQYQCIK